MRYSLDLKTLVLCSLASVLSFAGCAHTMHTESTEIRQAVWQANLDDCRDVCLSVVRVHAHDEGEPERAYEKLTLEVRPRESLHFESMLKSVELRSGAGSRQFDFDEIHVRADESRSRVWFIDSGSGRVIATLDAETGVTTGPGEEPPAWATADAGDLLRAVE
jgi:hypothetical protein